MEHAFDLAIESQSNVTITDLKSQIHEIEKKAKTVQDNMIFDHQNQKILMTAELNKEKIEFK